jgi:hypothetical protein
MGDDRVKINPKNQRMSLFAILAHVLGTSQKKFDMEKSSNNDRQKWARIIVSAVEAYGHLLETSQLEDLEDRLAKLEKQQGKQEVTV